MNIRIMITDDHPLIINGLENIINKYNNIEIIGTYLSGSALLKSLNKQQPDVILLDIHMPGQTGDDIARSIAQQYPKIYVIALTHLDNIYYIKSMLQQGVLGYLLKSTNEDMLIQAITTVAKGKLFLDPKISVRIQKDKLSISKQVAHGTVLTRREKEVLFLLADNFNSNEIAEKLFVGKRTIDTHRENLLLKLEVKNTPALIKKAMDMGLLG